MEKDVTLTDELLELDLEAINWSREAEEVDVSEGSSTKFEASGMPASDAEGSSADGAPSEFEAEDISTSSWRPIALIVVGVDVGIKGVDGKSAREVAAV